MQGLCQNLKMVHEIPLQDEVGAPALAQVHSSIARCAALRPVTLESEKCSRRRIWLVLRKRLESTLLDGEERGARDYRVRA